MLATPQGVHNSHDMYQTTINIVNIHVYFYGQIQVSQALYIPQFVLILMLYTRFYVHLCHTVQIEK